VTGCATYLIEPSGFATRSLRRFARGDSKTCPHPSNYGYHNAETPDGDVSCRLEYIERYQGRFWVYSEPPEPPHDDSRWPTACACGYTFTADDAFQVFHDTIYRRVDGTNERILLRDNPPGAMYYSEWHMCHHEPRCEKHLFAICPDGRTWEIDGRCSNCGSPNDRTHRCWVRHGEPPMITVDKAGVTCNAGAGSIATGTYHGSLQNGRFTDG
jgi:hypothetical protein